MWTEFVHFLQVLQWCQCCCWSLDYTLLPGGSEGKESAFSVGDPGSIPGSGKSPAEGNSNPLQHSCLENPIGWRAWQATVHGVAKSWKRLSDFTFFTLHSKDLELHCTLWKWVAIWYICEMYTRFKDKRKKMNSLIYIFIMVMYLNNSFITWVK